MPEYVEEELEKARRALADAGEVLVEDQGARSGDANRVLFGFDPNGPLGTMGALTIDDGATESNWGPWN